MLISEEGKRQYPSPSNSFGNRDSYSTELAASRLDQRSAYFFCKPGNYSNCRLLPTFRPHERWPSKKRTINGRASFNGDQSFWCATTTQHVHSLVGRACPLENPWRMGRTRRRRAGVEAGVLHTSCSAAELRVGEVVIVMRRTVGTSSLQTRRYARALEKDRACMTSRLRREDGLSNAD